VPETAAAFAGIDPAKYMTDWMLTLCLSIAENLTPPVHSAVFRQTHPEHILYQFFVFASMEDAERSAISTSNWFAENQSPVNIFGGIPIHYIQARSRAGNFVKRLTVDEGALELHMKSFLSSLQSGVFSGRQVAPAIAFSSYSAPPNLTASGNILPISFLPIDITYDFFALHY
jgi:hypothetical protein